MSKRFLRSLWSKLPQGLRKKITGLFAQLATRKLSASRPLKTGDVVIAGLLGTVSGLGEGVRQLVKRLHEVGIPAGTSNLSRALLLEDIDGGSVWSNSFSEGGVLILSINPNQLAFAFSSIGAKRIASRYVIGIWYWELQSFPPSWKQGIDCVDELWAGSNFVAEGLRKIAGSKPVHVVPLPLCVESFPDKPTRDPLPELAGKTVVFFTYDVRSTHARKNPEAVVKAFRLAAGNNPDCALLLKINNSDLWPESEARVRQQAEGLSNVHILREKLSDEAMKNLFARVDIVLSLHRSEGFGLLMAEAMAAGKPVIATGWSANTDFMTPETSILIDYKLIPVTDDQHNYDGLNAVWAEPDIAQAAEALRRLIAAPEERARLGKAGREHIQRYLSKENWVKSLPDTFWKYTASRP